MDPTSLLFGDVKNKKEQAQLSAGMTLANLQDLSALGITKQDLQTTDFEEVKPDVDAEDFGNVSDDDDDDQEHAQFAAEIEAAEASYASQLDASAASDMAVEEAQRQQRILALQAAALANKKSTGLTATSSVNLEEIFTPNTILAKPRREQDGPILRFTELFGSKKFFGVKKYLQQLKAKKKFTVKLNADGFDSDEEGIFEQYQPTVKAHIVPTVQQLQEAEKKQKKKLLKIRQQTMAFDNFDNSEDDDDDDDDQFEGLMDDKQKQKQLQKLKARKRALTQDEDEDVELSATKTLSELDKNIIQRTSLSLVDQVEWENEIIWEDQAHDNYYDNQQQHQQQQYLQHHNAASSSASAGVLTIDPVHTVGHQPHEEDTNMLMNQQNDSTIESPSAMNSDNWGIYEEVYRKYHGGDTRSQNGKAGSSTSGGYSINQAAPNKVIIAPAVKEGASSSSTVPAVREITSSAAKGAAASASTATGGASTANSAETTSAIANGTTTTGDAATTADSSTGPSTLASAVANSKAPEDKTATASSSSNPLPEPAEEALSPEEIKRQARKRYYRKKKEREAAELLAQTTIKREIKREVEHDQLIPDDIDTIQTSTNQKFKRGLNEGLLQGDWEDMIIWDDEIGPKKQPITDLVFDMNDENIIFANELAQAKAAAALQKKKKAKQAAGDSGDEQQTTSNTISSYNVSLDNEYEEFAALLGPQRKEGKHIVRHSLPALRLEREFFKTHVPKEELRHFHRPFFCFRKGEKVPIVFKVPKAAKRGKRKQKIIEKKQDLSVCDHHFVLMEHVEPIPSMINNTGMGNYIVNYFKKKLDDSAIPKCDDGVTKVIESQDMLPLLGLLRDGEIFTALENSMYSAQIFPHKQFNKQQKHVDFMLIMKKSESGSGHQFYIREIPGCYTVGHTQVHNEVPAPNSTPARVYLQSRLAWFIHRTFKDQLDAGHSLAKIRIDDIVEAFPDESPTTVRRCLRDCAGYQRGGDGNGTWIANKDKIPSEEELQALVTPEMVCANESMLAGELRHNDCALSENTCIAAFASSFAKLGQKDRDVIRFIARERKRAPWNKTANFLDFLNRKEGSKLPLLEVASQNFTTEELARLNVTAEKAIAESVEAENAQEGEKDGDNESTLTSSTAATQLKKPDERKKKGIKNTQVREILRYVFAKEAERLSKGISYFDHWDSSNSAGIDALEKNVNGGMDDEEDFNEFEREFDEIADQQGGNNANNNDEEEDDDAGRILHNMFDDDDDNNARNTNADMDDNMSVTSQKAAAASALASGATSAAGSNSSSAAAAAAAAGKRGKKENQEKQKRYIVRKTVTVTNPVTGEKEKKVELIRDPDLVNFYKKKKENWESAKSKKKHKSIPFFGGDPADFFQVGPQDRRRLQDNFRRFKQLLEQQRAGATKSRSALIGTNDTISTKKRKQREKKLAKKKTAKEGTAAGASSGGSSRSKSSAAKDKLSSVKVSTPSSTASGAAVDGNNLSTPTTGIKLKFNKEIFEKAATSTEKPASGSKNKKKKPAGEDAGSGDEYHDPTPQGKRRRQTTGQKVNEILKHVLYNLRVHAFANPFMQPVKLNDPVADREYRRVVAKPMDLLTMERKITNLEYLDHNAFLADIELIVNNARMYCTGRHPEIPPQGDQLLQCARDEIAKVEATISETLKEPAPKSIKKAKKKSSTGGAGSSTPNASELASTPTIYPVDEMMDAGGSTPFSDAAPSSVMTGIDESIDANGAAPLDMNTFFA